MASLHDFRIQHMNRNSEVDLRHIAPFAMQGQRIHSYVPTATLRSSETEACGLLIVMQFVVPDVK